MIPPSNTQHESYLVTTQSLRNNSSIQIYQPFSRVIFSIQARAPIVEKRLVKEDMFMQNPVFTKMWLCWTWPRCTQQVSKSSIYLGNTRQLSVLLSLLESQSNTKISSLPAAC